jgi:hypothetical protein
VIALDVDLEPFVVEDGATVAVITPPAGGRMVFAGARVANLDPCAAQLAGSLREMGGDLLKAVRLDSRTIHLLAAGDGWGTSDPGDISTFANIPVCPNQWADSDVFDVDYELRVTVTDRDGRTATTSRVVRPACLLGDGLLNNGGREPRPPEAFLAECLCMCRAGYELGDTCEGEGGAGGR